MATNTLARVQAKLVLDPETGCLLWPGHLDRNGYARVGAGRSGHKIGLHVFVWEAVHGPVPPGMQIDHVYSRGCRYRHCGNIMHLEAVTPKTNSGRRDEVHPPIQFCRRGLHELTPENIVPRDDGRRRCRACRHYKGSQRPERRCILATVWSPAPYIHKQEWLLSDGSIVTSPDFEATSSGRRIRVAGTTESFGNKQAEALMARAMDKIAADRGVTKVMRLYPDADADAWAAAAVSLQPDIFTKAVTLHMLKENHSSGYTQSTTALWKFKVKDMPVFAYVFISLNQRREHYTIVPRVVFRNTLPNFGGDHSYFTYDESNGAASPGFYRYSSEAERITEWMKNHFVFEDFQDRAYPGQMRTAVVRFAEMCKRFDDLQNIQVPDLRKGHENIETFDLERHVSNYSGSFHNELMSFVQTGPVLDRIKDAYQTLITEFRTLGLIVKNQADDSAIAQALNGDATAVKCTLEPNEDVEVRNDALDPYHTVTFDFASGTVVVNCTHSENLNEVAEAWDIAKFKAEMLGEEDVLMEYAKAYRNPKEQKRLLKIIGQRAVPDA